MWIESSLGIKLNLNYGRVLGYVCGIVVQVDAGSVRVGTSSLTSSYTKIENSIFLAIFQLFSL